MRGKEKCREASLFRADGVVKDDANSAFRNILVSRPPRPLQVKWLRTIFLMSRPPLLTRRGLCRVKQQPSVRRGLFARFPQFYSRDIPIWHASPSISHFSQCWALSRPGWICVARVSDLM
jgi:hypothetical protein